MPGRTGRLAGWKKRFKDAVRRRAARENRRRKRWFAVLTVASLALLVLAAHQSALADEGLIEEGWTIEEIEFELPEPVPGRRLYMERLEVSGDRARVSLRAATDLEVLALVFGGEESRPLRMWWPATLGGGESNDYDLPLSGESPSLDFSWEDSLGQAGAISLEGRQLPYPLPSFEGELCDLRVVSVEWAPGTVSGAVSSECAPTVEERVDVDVAAGHHSQTVTAVVEGSVIAMEGTLRVDAGGATAVSFPLVPNGETRFSVNVERGEMVHTVAIEAALEATVEVEIPPLVRLTHHPERTEELSGTVDGRAAGGEQVGQQDGPPDPRRRDDHGARGLGPPHDTAQNGPGGLHLRLPPRGAGGGRGRGSSSNGAEQGRDGAPVAHPVGRLGIQDPQPARARGDGHGRSDVTDRRGDREPAVRTGVVGEAGMRKFFWLTTSACAVLVLVGAAQDPEELEMLRAFDAALTAMAYAAAGLCLFSIVWAGFVLMAEGSDQQGAGRARRAVAGAVLGLVLVLSAKGVALALRSGIVLIP